MHAAIKYQNESYINSFVNDLLIWFLGVFLTEKKPVIPVMLPCLGNINNSWKKKKVFYGHFMQPFPINR